MTYIDKVKLIEHVAVDVLEYSEGKALTFAGHSPGDCFYL